MEKIPPNSMWKLKSEAEMSYQWKVTGRYNMELRSKEYIECVRVSYYGRNGCCVRHYSVERFLQLYEKM